MLNIYNQKNGNNNHTLPDQNEATPKNRPNFSRYTDPTGEFDTKEFKFGLWYAKNKVTLYRVTIGILISISAIFWIYTILKGGSLILYSLEKSSNLDRDLSSFYNYTAIHPAYSPQPLLIADTNILSSGSKKYDLIGEVSNPNERFYVTFDYYFIANGEPTEKQTTFLLPQESRLVTFLGFDKADYVGSAGLVIENVRWDRISNHDIVDIASWQAERLNFIVNNFSFLRFGNTEDPSANVIKFDIQNDSAYSFVQPDFIVGLYQSNSLVGVMPLELNQFKAGETKSVDLRNFVSGLNVTDVKLFPIIDIYQKSSYLPPES